MSTPASRDERGMILINVLLIVMLATAVLAIMLAGDDSNLERNLQLRNAAQAMAVARGGELSAITALRRDLAAGSTVDAPSEAWAQIDDRAARIPGGTFTFAVSDAQAKFNLNNAARGDAGSLGTLRDVVRAAALPDELTAAIVLLLQYNGPVSNLSALAILGLDPVQLARLAQFCTVLPSTTDVNLNAVPEPLLAILIGNATIARSIVALRARRGGLTPADLTASGIIQPPGTSLSSDYFWARSRVTIGDTPQQLTSLLHRQTTNGRPQVLAIRRWRGVAPVMAPPLVTSPTAGA